MPGPSFLGVGPLQIDSASASYFLNGNVGIGTTSPFTKVANSPTNYLVNSIGVGTNSLLWRSNEAGYTASFVQDAAGGALNQAGVSINIAEIANNVAPDKNAALAVLSGNIMRLMVAANGNVGIGTTIPGAKLDVSGDVAIPNFGSGAAYRGRRGDGAIKPLLFVQNDADLADATRLRSAGSGVAIQSDAGANLVLILNGGDVKLSGPLAQIHGRSLVGLAANANNDLLNNVGPTGNVYWYKGNQGGGAQAGGTQLMRLRDDGALLMGSTPRVAIDSGGYALYG